MIQRFAIRVLSGGLVDRSPSCEKSDPRTHKKTHEEVESLVLREDLTNAGW